MKILHLSFSDSDGGAARAAYRIHHGLLEAGADSQMLVIDRRTRDSSIARFQPSTVPIHRIKRALRRYGIQSRLARNQKENNCQLFSGEKSWLGPELAANLPPCDLVHLHWIAGMVDYPDFLPQVAKRTPLVWTLHDMNPFTGGCHYDGHCGRFTQNCGSCPMLDAPQERDLSRQVFEAKRAAFAKVPCNRLQFVTPSHWLTREASRSSLLRGRAVSTIPYGLNLKVFAPRDKSFARQVLGIPPNARVVLFVAHSLSDQRKGHRVLMQALEPLQDVFLLSVGSGQPPAQKNALHLGFVEQDSLMSLVYSAADLFAATSLEDNLPQTVLEAMACGVPVLGFNVGGIPDAVQHEVTGLLIPAGDSTRLSEAISMLLNDQPTRERMGAQSRICAETKFAGPIQAHAYLDLYAKCLSS